MLNVRQILVSALGLALVGVGLAGCGQKGSLYLPTEAAAKNRATLPDLIVPGRAGADATTGTPPASPPQAAPAAGGQTPNKDSK